MKTGNFPHLLDRHYLLWNSFSNKWDNSNLFLVHFILFGWFAWDWSHSKWNWLLSLFFCSNRMFCSLQVKDHPYVTGNEPCRPIIIETLRFLYDLEMIGQKDGEVPTPDIARPRVPHEVLFAIGGWSGGSPTNFVETYDTRADRWVKVTVLANYNIKKQLYEQHFFSP